MKNLLVKLWNDDAGAVIASELIFVATILVVGLVTSLKALQASVNNELADLASAIGSMNQSYSYGGTRSCMAFTAGSQFIDSPKSYEVHTADTVKSQDAVLSCD